MIKARLDKVLAEMSKQNLPQMLVSDPAGIFYLTGKWIHPGERMLALYLNVNGEHKIFINELFPVSEDLGVEKVWFSDVQDSIEIVAKYVQKDKVMGVDKIWPAKFLLKLMEYKGGSSFVNASSILDAARACKDENEKDFMRESSKINDLVMGKLVKLLATNPTEKVMAKAVGEYYEEFGCSGFSFSPIISYGANGADPHHSPDNSKFKDGDSIMIDIGGIKDSYCSDMTRTLFYKSASAKAKEVYDVVLQANLRAIAKVKPGVRFCDIDAAARDYIEEKGYGKYFTHRLGHSIGLEDHDYGDVSSANTDKLQPGMIFSIEPGIYLTGEFGIRIEDLVIVTEDGCEVLNKYNKELTILA